MRTEIESCFRDATLWHQEAIALRAVLAGCPIKEGVKWGKPCYFVDGGNICIIQRMNSFLALMFFKGSLLDNTDGLLREQGPNSRSARRLEFTSASEITSRSDAIRRLIANAIEIELQGLKVDLSDEIDLPEELGFAFDDDPDFRTAFEALTPGRQRGYVLNISQAKQSKTREARVEKHRPRIMDGKGLMDR